VLINPGRLWSSIMEIAEIGKIPGGGCAGCRSARKTARPAISLAAGAARRAARSRSMPSATTALEARLRERGSADGPQTLNEALEQWIWHPVKMGGSARWKTDKAGSPSPYCCFYMRAYDLAKFGEFVLRELNAPGARLREYLIKASTYDGEPVKPRCFSQGEPFLLGYGYQWWVFKNAELGFTGIGTGGQFLHIIPESNMVIVQFSSVDNDDFETFKCASFSAHKLIQDVLDRQ
jgi:CubicO group peptidase (beta-lactamase class C family)